MQYFAGFVEGHPSEAIPGTVISTVVSIVVLIVLLVAVEKSFKNKEPNKTSVAKLAAFVGAGLTAAVLWTLMFTYVQIFN